MTRKQTYPNPKFTSAEEEAAYWQEHSPLLEGYEISVKLSSPKRTSFLSVRLDGVELEALRQAAIRQGIKPSTLARNLVLQGLRAEGAAKDLADRVAALEHQLREMEGALRQAATG